MSAALAALFVTAFWTSGTMGDKTQVGSRRGQWADSESAAIEASVPPSVTASSGAVLPGWGAPVWRDDFNGDLSQWRVRNNEQLSYDLATVQAENVRVRGGRLVITTRRERERGRHWTTGYIDTAGKFSQQYGRFEARIKVNTTASDSAGIWPAFWMRPDDGNVTGEIDIMEAWGEPSTTRADYRSGSGTWTVHQNTNGRQDKRDGWLTAPNSPRLSDNFHVYGVEWTPRGFLFLLDGRPVRGGSVSATDAGWIGDSFSAPFHLRIQTQVGQPSYWGVPTAETRQPTELLVDWVRTYVYKK